MTTLTIDRLSSTVHGGDPRRVRRMLARLAERRLDDALREAGLPDGIWCVRRVDVLLRIDFDRPDPALESDWARTLIDALRVALSRGGTDKDVVYYRTEQHALADLVACVAVGRFDRSWAWERIGLPGATGISPQGTIVTALRERPNQVVPVLLRAVRAVGVPALHRYLGREGWTALAELTHTNGRTSTTRQVGDEHARTLAARLVTQSVLAAEILGSRLRTPDRVVLHAWSELVITETDPTAHSIAAHVVDVLAPPRCAMTTTRVNLRSASTTSTRPPTPDEQVGGRCTRWAGLLFLLNTAQEAGIPQRLLEDPSLAAWPLSSVLQAIAHALVPMTADDPAVLAFAGLAPDQPPPESLDVEVDRHAEHWAAVTAVRLEPDDMPLIEVLRRDGEIVGEPGWLDVRLSMRSVDVAVRRAGLDLDPEWVPWLGTVVKFRYE